MTGATHPRSIRIAGIALACFAFEIGFQVDLDRAQPLFRRTTRRRVVRARRPAPVWFDYGPPPLRLVVAGEPVAVDDRETEAAVELLSYGFGAALLTYRMPLPGDLNEPPRLGAALYEHVGPRAVADSGSPGSSTRSAPRSSDSS